MWHRCGGYSRVVTEYKVAINDWQLFNILDCYLYFTNTNNFSDITRPSYDVSKILRCDASCHCCISSIECLLISRSCPANSVNSVTNVAVLWPGCKEYLHAGRLDGRVLYVTAWARSVVQFDKETWHPHFSLRVLVWTCTQPVSEAWLSLSLMKSVLESVLFNTSGYATMVHGRGCNPHRSFANL